MLRTTRYHFFVLRIEIIVIKEGIIHGQTEGGDLFYDTKTTNLHFDDIITRIEGVLVQDLKSIIFGK